MQQVVLMLRIAELLLLTVGLFPHLAILLGFLNLALLACRRLSFLPLGLSWCDRSVLGI